MTRQGILKASARLFLFMACLSSSRATDVLFSFENSQQQSQSVTGRVFRVKMVSTNGIANGVYVVGLPEIITNTFTGTVIISNMVPTIYDCLIVMSPASTPFRITVPDTNTLVEASTILTQNALPTQTYTTTAANNRFVGLIDSWSLRQLLTNAWLRGGTDTNVFYNTNGTAGQVLTAGDRGAYWANATGGGGGSSTNGLATTNYVNSITNGLATTNYVNSATNGLVTASVTNSLATTNYVNTVVASATNGIAPLKFDITQFSTGTGGTNIAAASGIQLTNPFLQGVINGGFSYSNAVTGSDTNFVVFSDQGIQGFAPGRSLWKFYSWFNTDKAIDWAGSSILWTNGGMTVAGITNTGAAQITGAVGIGGTLTATGAVATLSTVTNAGAINNAGIVTNWNTVVFKGSTNIFQHTNGAVADYFIQSQDGTNDVWLDLNPPQFIFIGDSLTASVLSPSGLGQDWPAKLMVKTNFYFHGRSANFARGGSLMSQWASTYYDTDVTNFLGRSSSSTNRWLFVEGGINDVVNSETFVNLTNNASQLWKRGRTNWCFIAAFTVPTNNNGTMSAAENQVRTNYNVWVRTNGLPYNTTPLYDFLVDMDLLITNATGQLIDGIHWKAAENERLASVISTNFPVYGSAQYWNRLQAPAWMAPETITVSSGTYAQGGMRVGGGTTAGTFVNGAGVEHTYGDLGEAWSQAYNRDNTNWLAWNLRGNRLSLWGYTNGVIIQDVNALPAGDNPDGGWSRLYVMGNAHVQGKTTFDNQTTNLSVAYFNSLLSSAGARIEQAGTFGAGQGMELLHNAGVGGSIQSYNRDASAWLDTQITSKDIIMYPVRDFRIDNRGAALGYVLTATNANGAGVWQPPAIATNGATALPAISANTFLLLDSNKALYGSNVTQVVSNSFNAMWPNSFVFAGDSLTEFAGSSGSGQEWPAKLMTKTNFYWHDVKSINVASGATTAAQWVSTHYNNRVVPLAPSGTNYGWLFVWLGGNDIVNSAPFTQVTNDVSQLWARGRTNNFKIVAFTISTNSNGTMSAAEDQVRTNFNVWVRTNSVNTDAQGRKLYDYLVDVDLLITNSPGQTVDGIHWKPAETDRLATFISTNFPDLAPTTFWAKIPPPFALQLSSIQTTNAAYADGGFRISGGATSGTFTHGGGLEITYDGNAVYEQAYSRAGTNWVPQNIRADSVNIWPTVGSVTIQDSGGLPTTNTDTAARFTVQGGKVKFILPSGHNTNAFEVWRGASILAGVESNGVAFLQITNDVNKFPASYRLFSQTFDYLGATNYSTATNALLGGIGVGTTNLPANFWQVGRTVELHTRGLVWTAAAAGSHLFMVNCWNGTTPNTIATNISAPANSLVGDSYEIFATITCRTNSSIGFLQCSGKIYFPTAAGGTGTTARELKRTGLIFDTTAASKLSLDSTNGAATTGFQALTSTGVIY